MALFLGVAKVHEIKELKYTPKGTAVLSFSFAQKNGYGDNATFDWYQAALWGATAENLAGKIQKGTRCFLAGTQKVKTYEKRDGTTGVAIEVNVFHFEFAGEAPKQESNPEQDNGDPDF